MSVEHRTHVRKWLEKADHDIIAAKTLIDVQPLILDVICFHCQQAVEKYLKAFLVYNRVDIKKTHDLRLLQNMCSKIDSSFSELDFKDLNTYAVQVRYPDFVSPPMEEVKEYFLIAQKVKKFMLSKIIFD